MAQIKEKELMPIPKLFQKIYTSELAFLLKEQ